MTSRCVTVLAVLELPTAILRRSDDELLDDARKLVAGEGWPVTPDEGRSVDVVKFLSVTRGVTRAALDAGAEEDEVVERRGVERIRVYRDFAIWANGVITAPNTPSWDADDFDEWTALAVASAEVLLAEGGGPGRVGTGPGVAGGLAAAGGGIRRELRTHLKGDGEEEATGRARDAHGRHDGAPRLGGLQEVESSCRCPSSVRASRGVPGPSAALARAHA